MVVHYQIIMVNEYDLAYKFSEIYQLDIVHRAQKYFKYNLKSTSTLTYISDFGLNKLITENIKNLPNKTIARVLQHMTPEVLIEEEYTKAADVYSFAFVV
ncbi:hypothetical protein Glove_320g122 [Diversispora epigaea]|uniref:Protein kinase domain-containing protein n=1 Tax=Diversispora epigaea TaxID=1348612 RepID=A0A397HUH0_9GLOM|nr:hypothetical protein Glove_320g122 [Diversispora epigaea]